MRTLITDGTAGREVFFLTCQNSNYSCISRGSLADVPFPCTKGAQITVPEFLHVQYILCTRVELRWHRTKFCLTQLLFGYPRVKDGQQSLVSPTSMVTHTIRQKNTRLCLTAIFGIPPWCFHTNTFDLVVSTRQEHIKMPWQQCLYTQNWKVMESVRRHCGLTALSAFRTAECVIIQSSFISHNRLHPLCPYRLASA